MSDSSPPPPRRPGLRELASTKVKAGDRVLVEGVPHRVLDVVRTRWGSLTCKVVKLEGDATVGLPRYVAPTHLEPIDG